MKNCKLCKLSQHCNDLPAFCFILQYIIVLGVIGGASYLFFQGGLFG